MSTWSEEDVRRVAELVRVAPRPFGMTTAVVAIDGFGGAGKSTLATLLAAEVGAPVVHTDDFASAEVPLEWWPRLLDQVLLPLSRDETARYQRYDWPTGALAEWIELPPAPVVVVEGVSASRSEFAPFLACAVWVDTPWEERLRRGLERDGQAAREMWLSWMSDEDAWAERDRPQERSGLILSGSGA